MQTTRPLGASWVAPGHRRPVAFGLVVVWAALALAACSDSASSVSSDAGARIPRDATAPSADAGRTEDAAAGAAPDARAPDASADARPTDGDAAPVVDAARPVTDATVRPDGGSPDARPADSDATSALDAGPALEDAEPVMPDVGDPCGAAIDLNAAVARDGYAEGDTSAGPARTLGSCGGAAGGEVVFVWRAEPDDVEVTFVTDFAETRAPTVLYVRSACDAPADLACARGSDEAPGTRVVFEPPAPGVYYVVVDTGSRDGGGPFRLGVERSPRPACADARDNDGDGRTDAADLGCSGADDDTEGDPAAPPLCADGLDNDEDGVTDWPADADCEAAGDDAERGDACVDDAPCGGANLGPGFVDNSSTGGPWIAFRFRPAADQTVFRLEVFTGEAAGQNVLELWSSDPVTDAPSARLATARWDQARENGFQGAELDVPVEVAAGVDHWVVWQPVGGSQSPFDVGGDAIDYRGSPDQGRSWNGPFQAPCKFRVECCRR